MPGLDRLDELVSDRVQSRPRRLAVGFGGDAAGVAWHGSGSRQATQIAIMCGIGVACILFMASIFWVGSRFSSASPLRLPHVLVRVASAPRGGEESSSATTSRRATPASTRRADPDVRRKGSFLSRWLERREARQIQREHEQQEADERRMDELLDKIQRHGKESLTAEETQFMKCVSQKYRNRN